MPIKVYPKPVETTAVAASSAGLLLGKEVEISKRNKISK